MRTLFIIIGLLSSLASASQSHFHVAFPIGSEQGIQEFYKDLLGGKIDRKKVNDTVTFAIELDGHSIVMRVYPNFVYQRLWIENDVIVENKTYKNVDAQHFGLIVSKERWLQIKNKVLHLQQTKNDVIEITPVIKNEGTPHEVGFMILKAPSGYSFEVKYTTSDVHTGIQAEKSHKDL